VFDDQRREARVAEERALKILDDLGITRGRLDVAREQARGLRESWARVQRALAESRQAAVAANREVEKTRAELDRTFTDLEAAGERVETLQMEKEAAETRRDELMTGLEGSTARLKQLGEDHSRISNELAEALTATEAAEERVKDLLADLAAKGDEVAKAEARAHDAEKRAAESGKAQAPEPVREDVKKILALAEQPGDEAFEALAVEVHNRDKEVRAAAMRALGIRGVRDDASLKLLLTLFDRLHKDDEVEWRARVIDALGESGRMEAAGPIVGLLNRGHAADSPVYRAGIRSLGRLRTTASLEYLLAQLDELKYRTGGQPGPRVKRGKPANQKQQTLEQSKRLPDVLSALRELTGLPFKDPKTWKQWGQKSGRDWRPTSLGIPTAGKKFRSEGWRFRLERPDEPRWGFSRTEETVIRVVCRPADAAWFEVRACAAAEKFPRGDDEKKDHWERRLLEEAASRARSPLAKIIDISITEKRVPLGRASALRIEADSSSAGSWKIYCLERNGLLYTLTSHHEPEASEDTQKQLDQILASFRVLDSR